jgi:hypothetical protein
MPLLFRAFAGLVCLAVLGLALSAVPALAAEPSFRIASGPPPAKPETDAAAEKEPTPERKMQKRFPHPVRVGDLIGLPVLDDDDSTIGFVRDVARTAEGKTVLIVPYSAWFGWARTAWGKRPVAVPIETVVILARQINAVDMPRGDFDEAETWEAAQGKIVPVEEKTLIGLGRR